MKIKKYWKLHPSGWRASQITELRSTFNEQSKYLNDNKISKKQLAVIKSIRKYQNLLINLINKSDTNLQYSVKKRIIHAGVSDYAEAWTDGVTRIGIDKKILTYADKGIGGWSYIAHLLIHEYLHVNGENLHNIDFYENFHNITLSEPFTIFYGGSDKENAIVRFIKKCNRFYLKDLEKNNYTILSKTFDLNSITKTSD